MRISDWSSDVCSSDLRGRVDAEAVVLAGDEHAPGIEVLHGVVGAVVAGFHLDGLAADGQAHDLVAQADAEGGQLALEEHPRGGDGVVRSEEHTSELQSLMRISYAVFCLKNKKK